MPAAGTMFLENKELELVLFGGKGGVGKTTAAAATALYMAQRNPEKKILVVSTDPAHSLADSFDMTIGDEIVPFKGLDNLFVLQPNASLLLDVFKEEHEVELKKIINRGTLLDQRDIADFFSLALPGMDELMAIVEVMELTKDRKYEMIILDTAPTGHTIRLLALPGLMKEWVRVMSMMLEKHNYIRSRFTRRPYKGDEADKFVKDLSRDIERVTSLFKDSRKTEFVLVLIPEAMSITETQRFLDVLNKVGIKVNSIILNRVVRVEGCDFCSTRKQNQTRHIQEVEERFSDYNIFQMPLFPHEVRGAEHLVEFAKILFGKGYDPCIKSALRRGERPFALTYLFKRIFPHSTRKLDLLKKDLQFIIFAGKGGVGKTSVAAATALHLANKNKQKKILVFSTDPAHSLSDSFDYPIRRDEITRLNEINNLYALEIDAESKLKELTAVYMKEIDIAFSSLKRRSVDITYDYRTMKELFTISPPGLDEIIALSAIAEMAGKNEYETFILDTAPTGHLIRFLELPHIILDWLKLIFRTILKYREALRLCQFECTIEKLMKLSRSIKGIRTALVNAKRSELVVVTIPEAMGVMETERLCHAVAKLEIPCRHLITNMVIPETKCSFCAPMRNEQQTYIEEIKAKFPDYNSFEIPLFREEIRGMNNLTSLARFMYG